VTYVSPASYYSHAPRIAYWPSYVAYRPASYWGYSPYPVSYVPYGYHRDYGDTLLGITALSLIMRLLPLMAGDSLGIAPVSYGYGWGGYSPASWGYAGASYGYGGYGYGYDDYGYGYDDYGYDDYAYGDDYGYDGYGYDGWGYEPLAYGYDDYGYDDWGYGGPAYAEWGYDGFGYDHAGYGWGGGGYGDAPVSYSSTYASFGTGYGPAVHGGGVDPLVAVLLGGLLGVNAIGYGYAAPNLPWQPAGYYYAEHHYGYDFAYL
jgi:hypothetical protein